MAKKQAFKVGDKIRLTGKFLRSTGQYTGHDAHRTWTVLRVEEGKYGSSDFLTVDQPQEDMSYWTQEEIDADPMLKWRRINAANCILASRPDHT